MNVFVTGATGWIGSAVVDELLSHGRDVVGVARSEVPATLVAAKGAKHIMGISMIWPASELAPRTLMP